MTAPHITDAEIAELRAAMAERAYVRTHADNCWLWRNHQDCAIHRLLAEIERLRAELEEQRALNQEAKDAMPPGTQGPGLLGGVLHLREQLDRQRIRAEAAEEELERAYYDAKEGAELREETP